MDPLQLLNLIPATIAANPWVMLAVVGFTYFYSRRNPSPAPVPSPTPGPTPSPTPAPAPTGRPGLDLLARLLALAGPFLSRTPAPSPAAAAPAVAEHLAAVPVEHLAAVRDAIGAELAARARALAPHLASLNTPEPARPVAP